MGNKLFNKLRMKRNQGLTLTETMLAVAVGLVVLVAAMKIYPTIEKNQQEQDALTGLNELNANIIKAFSTQGNFNGLNNQTAIQMGLVPDVFQVNPSTGEILGPWSGNSNGTGGGNVDLMIGMYSNPAYFAIRYYNLPLSECLYLVSNFFPANLVGIWNGSQMISINSQSKQNALSIAQQACGTQDPVPSIDWNLAL